MTNRLFLLTLLLTFLSVYKVTGQQSQFQIKEVEGKNLETVRTGNYIQSIQSLNNNVNVFSYGRVKRITHDGIELATNPVLQGSGGFVSYNNVRNIEKIKVVKRSILPAIFTGCALTPLAIAFKIPIFSMGPIIGVSSIVILAISARKKNRKLYRNKVGKSVILITPGSEEKQNSYFEN